MSDIAARGTQCLKIIDWFETNETITPMQAMIHLHCMRLAARIADLEKMGYQFEHKMIYTTGDDGRSVHYMQYKKVS